MTTESTKQKIQAGIEGLQAAFPEIFNDNRPKPLALGITQQLAQARRSGKLKISLLTQRAAMNAWLHRPNYYRALAITPCRCNLDGTAAGFVHDDHRQHAIDRLKEIRKAKKARKAAIYQSKMRVAA